MVRPPLAKLFNRERHWKQDELSKPLQQWPLFTLTSCVCVVVISMNSYPSMCTGQTEYFCGYAVYASALTYMYIDDLGQPGLQSVAEYFNVKNTGFLWQSFHNKQIHILYIVPIPKWMLIINLWQRSTWAWQHERGLQQISFNKWKLQKLLLTHHTLERENLMTSHKV